MLKSFFFFATSQTHVSSWCSNKMHRKESRVEAAVDIQRERFIRALESKTSDRQKVRNYGIAQESVHGRVFFNSTSNGEFFFLFLSLSLSHTHTHTHTHTKHTLYHFLSH
jgi:hypothetical protein